MLNPADLIARAGTLATIPAVYLRLTDAAQDPRRSTAEVARILEEDAALSARLLRLANSAALGAGEPVHDVHRALRYVGLAQAIDLALTTAIIRGFAQRMPEQVAPREFWLHGAACGTVARLIARRTGRPSDGLFTAGVLHDIGRLLLLLVEPASFRRALQEASRDRIPLREAECRVLGFDHAALGGMLLSSWGLPPALAVAAGHHHAPAQATAHADVAAIVHVADSLAHVLGLGASGETMLPPVDPAAWQLLRLAAPDMEPLVHTIEQQYADIVQVLLLYEGPAPAQC